MKTLTPDEISALWDSPEEEEEEQGFVWDYDDPDVDSVYDQIKKYEYDTGTRGKRHNNPGAHIWTPEVQEKFGAGKGDSFVDEEGKTYHTAEYDTLEQGVEATKFLIDRKLKKEDIQGDPYRFYSEWSGKDIDSDTVQSFGNSVLEGFKQDTAKVSALSVDEIISLWDDPEEEKTPVPEKTPSDIASGIYGQYLINPEDYEYDNYSVYTQEYDRFHDKLKNHLKENGLETRELREAAKAQGLDSGKKLINNASDYAMFMKNNEDNPTKEAIRNIAEDNQATRNLTLQKEAAYREQDVITNVAGNLLEQQELSNDDLTMVNKAIMGDPVAKNELVWIAHQSLLPEEKKYNPLFAGGRVEPWSRSVVDIAQEHFKKNPEDEEGLKKLFRQEDERIEYLTAQQKNREFIESGGTKGTKFIEFDNEGVSKYTNMPIRGLHNVIDFYGSTWNAIPTALRMFNKAVLGDELLKMIGVDTEASYLKLEEKFKSMSDMAQMGIRAIAPAAPDYEYKPPDSFLDFITSPYHVGKTIMEQGPMMGVMIAGAMQMPAYWSYVMAAGYTGSIKEDMLNYENATGETIPEWKRDVMAASVGPVIAAIDRLSLGALTGIKTGGVGAGIATAQKYYRDMTAATKNSFAQIVLKSIGYVGAGVTEAATEGFQEWNELAVKSGYREVTQEEWDSMWLAAYAGGIMGSGVSYIHNVSTPMHAKEFETDNLYTANSVQFDAIYDKEGVGTYQFHILNKNGDIIKTSEPFNDYEKAYHEYLLEEDKVRRSTGGVVAYDSSTDEEGYESKGEYIAEQIVDTKAREIAENNGIEIEWKNNKRNRLKPKKNSLAEAKQLLFNVDRLVESVEAKVVEAQKLVGLDAKKHKKKYHQLLNDLQDVKSLQTIQRKNVEFKESQKKKRIPRKKKKELKAISTFKVKGKTKWTEEEISDIPEEEVPVEPEVTDRDKAKGMTLTDIRADLEANNIDMKVTSKLDSKEAAVKAVREKLEAEEVVEEAPTAEVPEPEIEEGPTISDLQTEIDRYGIDLKVTEDNKKEALSRVIKAGREAPRFTIAQFKKISEIKIYTSYKKSPEGKTRYGIRDPDGGWEVVWAKNENEAYNIAYQESRWSKPEVPVVTEPEVEAPVIKDQDFDTRLNTELTEDEDYVYTGDIRSKAKKGEKIGKPLAWVKDLNTNSIDGFTKAAKKLQSYVDQFYGSENDQTSMNVDEAESAIQSMEEILEGRDLQFDDDFNVVDAKFEEDVDAEQAALEDMDKLGFDVIDDGATNMVILPNPVPGMKVVYNGLIKTAQYTYEMLPKKLQQQAENLGITPKNFDATFKSAIDGFKKIPKNIKAWIKKVNRAMKKWWDANKVQIGEKIERAMARTGGIRYFTDPKHLGKQPQPPKEFYDDVYKKLPDLKDVEGKLRRKLNRKKDVGNPKNRRRVLDNGKVRVTVGNKTTQDWWDDVSQNLSRQEIKDARSWYIKVESEFKKIYGDEYIDYMVGWLASQKQTSPIQAMEYVLRVFEQEATGAKGKKGGVSDSQLRELFKNKKITSGLGAKLFDFIDSAIGSTTRRFFGNNVQAGQPVVVDRHTFRDRGYVSPTFYNSLVSQFGKNKLKKLKLDTNVEGPTDTQYERTSEWFQELTKWLNDNNIDGGNWTTSEVQAVGWIAVQKITEGAEETSVSAVESRVSDVSFELMFGEGSPYESKYKELSGLSEEALKEITYKMNDSTLDILQELTGVKIISRTNGLGWWMDYGSNANTTVKIIGSKAGVDEAMSIIGLLAQQTEVFASKANIKGTNVGLDITGKNLTDDNLNEIYETLRKTHRNLIIGASQTENGLRIIIPIDNIPKMKVKERIEYIRNESDRMAKLLTDTVAGIDIPNLDMETFVAETHSVENKWDIHKNGESYIQRLRGRPESSNLQRRLEREYIPRFEKRLEEAIREAKSKEIKGKPEEVIPSIEAGFLGFTPSNLKLLKNTIIDTGYFVYDNLPSNLQKQGQRIGVTAQNFGRTLSEFSSKSKQNIKAWLKKVQKAMKRWWDDNKVQIGEKIERGMAKIGGLRYAVDPTLEGYQAQLNKLDEKLGKDKGAKKERAKLKNKIENIDKQAEVQGLEPEDVKKESTYTPPGNLEHYDSFADPKIEKEAKSKDRGTVSSLWEGIKDIAMVGSFRAQAINDKIFRLIRGYAFDYMKNASSDRLKSESWLKTIEPKGPTNPFGVISKKQKKILNGILINRDAVALDLLSDEVGEFTIKVGKKKIKTTLVKEYAKNQEVYAGILKRANEVGLDMGVIEADEGKGLLGYYARRVIDPERFREMVRDMEGKGSDGVIEKAIDDYILNEEKKKWAKKKARKQQQELKKKGITKKVKPSVKNLTKEDIRQIKAGLNAVVSEEYLGVEDGQEITMLEKKKAELRDSEKSKIISGAVFTFGRSGAAPGGTKQRTVDSVGNKLVHQYDDASNALLYYIDSMNKAIARKRLLENHYDAGYVTIDDDSDNINIGISSLVENTLAGELTPEEQNKTIKALSGVLDVKQTGEWTGKLKAVGLFWSLNDIGNTMTQLADIGSAMAVQTSNNPLLVIKNLSKAITNKSDIKLRDIAVDEIMQELSDPTRLMKMINTQFKMTGFKKFDVMMKETIVNTHIESMGQQVKKFNKLSRHKQLDLMSKITAIFPEGTENYNKVIKDLKSGDITPEVQELAFNGLLDYQPIGDTEMTYLYNKDGRFRIVYSLKTFALRIINRIVAEGYLNHQRSAKARAAGNIKDARAYKILQYKKPLRMIALLMLAGAGKDEVKDFYTGQKHSFKENVWDNLLGLFFMSQYTVDKFGDRGGFKELLSISPPFTGFASDVVEDLNLIRKFFSEEGLSENQSLKYGLKIKKHIPWVGDAIYYRFGRGRKMYLKKAIKRLNDKRTLTISEKKQLENLSRESGKIELHEWD